MIYVLFFFLSLRDSSSSSPKLTEEFNVGPHISDHTAASSRSSSGAMSRKISHLQEEETGDGIDLTDNHRQPQKTVGSNNSLQHQREILIRNSMNVSKKKSDLTGKIKLFSEDKI
jgi:hypothetical protein